VMNENTISTDACLTRGPKLVGNCLVNCESNISILSNNNRSVATEVHRHCFYTMSAIFYERFNGRRIDTEVEYINEETGSIQITNNTSSTINTLYDMMREACIMCQFNKTNSRQRRCFGRFHNKGTTCSKCRSSFSGHHCSWEIPRRYSSNESNRLFSDCQ